MESLNLLISTVEYPPYPIAGTGVFALNLTQSLKNHNVTVLTPGLKNAPKTETIGNINITRIDNKILSILNKFSSHDKNRSFIDRRILFGISLRKFFKENKNLNDYDLLHNIDLISGSFLDYKKLNNVMPTLTSVNDYYALISTWNPIKFPYKSSDFIFRYFHHNIIKYFNIKAIRESSRIIANSKFVANIVETKAKIPREKIDIVYRGIDYDKFDLKPYDNKYNSFNILFIGANMERKGLIYLVQAAKKIIIEFPKTNFTIIGDAPKIYLAKIDKFLEEEGIKDKFNFIKHISKDEVPDYHRKSNIFIMPSLVEGLGQVFFEAMTAQTPVIGTKVGGIQEIINKENGILINPNSSNEIIEAVRTIFSNPKLAKKIAKSGKNFVKNGFTKDIMTKNLVNIYNTISKNTRAF